MKARAILNPRAGIASERARDAVRQSNAWPGIEIVETKAPGDARRLAAEAAASGFDLVLSMGGDGTANDVAWGLLGSSTCFGLVPVGSGNGLARTLGIPLRPDAAVRALADAQVRRMDVGMVNGRPFLNVAGAGFDAAVGEDFQAHGRRGGRRGVLTYVRLSVLRTFDYQAETFALRAGETSFDGRALVVAFVNGRQYGGGAVMAPGARLDDGLLDVIVIEDAPLYEVAWNASRMFLGTIAKFRRYRHTASASAVLTGPGPLRYHRDGEPEEPVDRLEVSVLPAALPVLVPRATAENPRGPFGLS